MDRLAAQLDPLSAVLGLAGRGVAELVRVVVHMIAGLLSSGLIPIGGFVGVLAAYLVYYLLWITLAGWAFWYVILPGVASAVACLVVLKAWLKCLHASLFEAAYTAPGTQEPARQPAPSRQGRGRGGDGTLAPFTFSRASALDAGHSRGLVLAKLAGSDENCIAAAVVIMAAGC